MWALILKMFLFFLLAICALPSEWTSVSHGKWGNLYDEISHSFSFTCAQFFFLVQTIFCCCCCCCLPPNENAIRNSTGIITVSCEFFSLLPCHVKSLSFRSYHRLLWRRLVALKWDLWEFLRRFWWIWSLFVSHGLKFGWIEAAQA